MTVVTAQFQNNCVTIFVNIVCPAQMRCRSTNASRHQRCNRGIFAAVFFCTTDLCLIYSCCGITLTNTDINEVISCCHCFFSNYSCFFHEFDFCCALYNFYPVYNVITIFECRIRQTSFDCFLAFCREVICIQFCCNYFFIQSSFFQDICNIFIGMFYCRVYIVISISIDIFFFQICCQSCSITVLATTKPHGLFLIQRNDNTLMYIEGPTIETCQVVHVGRISYNQDFNTFF